MRVRALTFRKRFANIEHKNSWWATLGHTDEMECTASRNMTLPDINRFNNETFTKDSATAYHHVVYLIDSEPNDDNQIADNELWAENDGFLSVTRIHFPVTTDLQGQFKKINEHFTKLASNNVYSEISWRTYYTMELSDMVLVSKSRTFQTLSRWSLLATKCKLVGKAYTYFCIPGNMLDTNVELPSELENDCIDFVAIRFALRDNNAEDALSGACETLGKDTVNSPMRVAGNEDAIICGQHVSMMNLLKLYRKWYQDETVFDLFRDISTRIGAIWDKDLPKPENCDSDESELELLNDDNRVKLEKFSRSVLSKVQEKVLTHGVHGVTPESREWVRPLVELTNALVHMGSSATLDEPVFQILPGLNAFWDNVIDESEPLLDEPLYLRFAELCVQTMEHLMRAEGQLSQRLEVRPLAYDIPVFVLEYVTTFLLTLSNEMTKPDGNIIERICFLLVPSAEEDVSTVEPFRSNGSTPGLLVITVPFSLLYKPRQLIPALCHEIAHYVGEDLRMRELRYDYFLKCATKELITYFFENVVGEVDKFKDFIKDKFFDENLREGSGDLIEKYGDFIKIPLLKILGKVLVLADVLVETDGYADLVRSYVLSNSRGAQFTSVPAQSREERRAQFTKRIRDLSISFRETYADICMVHFLELTPKEYFDVSIRNWDMLNDSTLLRAYVILFTVGYTLEDIQKEFDGWGKSQQIDGYERTQILNNLKIIADRINDKGDTSEKFLAHYIKDCWNGLKSKCPKDGEKADGYLFSANDIYKKMLGLDSTTGYQEILAVIDNGRQIALSQLESVLQ